MNELSVFKKNIESSFYYFIVLTHIVGLISAAHVSVSQGLNPEKHLSQYVLSSWNTEDGLTSESTNDLLQTEDGYIWIATYTGLHRFDGLNFTIFNSQNSNIPSSNVLRLAQDQNGELWLGTLHGLAKFKNGQFYTPEALLPTKFISVEDMLINKNNDIWFSSKSNSLFYYKDSVLRDFNATFIESSSTILAIEEDNNGDVFFGTDDSKLWKYSLANDTIIQISLDIHVNGINCLLSDEEGLLIGSGSGLYVYTSEGIVKNTDIEDVSITSLRKDLNGNFWLGTVKGLIRFNTDTKSVYMLSEEKGLPNNIIRQIIFDKDQNLWGGTYRGGIFHLTDGLATTFSENDGLSTDIISSVGQLSENTFIFGNENGKLDLLRNDEITLYNEKISLPEDRLKHVFVDKSKHVWVSTYGGLYRFDGANVRKYNTSNGFPDNYIRMAFQDSGNNIWIGTKNSGLIKLSEDGEVINNVRLEDGLTSNYIMSIAEDENNLLIVGTINGINYLENGQVTKNLTVENGLPSNFSFSTLSIGDDLWIASNDGLIYYNPQVKESIVVFGRRKGMPSDIVYDVLNDDNGNLWLPSENSILKIPITELKKAMHENIQLEGIEQYDKSNGMKNNHCLGGVLSLKDKNGNFWIPTLEGAVFINPNLKLASNTQPKAIIQSINFNNQSFVGVPSIAVPPRMDRINIEYTGIGYENTENLVFRYKLKPFDKDWIYAGKLRNAFYTNLTPREYEFILQAGINDVYYESNASQIIVIDSSWYQTVWAKSFFLICVILISISFYLFRVKRLQIRNTKLEELIEERTAEINNQKDALSNTLIELSATQEKMVQSEKMASLGVLSAGVAHEINNPLNFIQGGVDALESLDFRNHKSSNDITNLISIMKEGVSRAADIVSSLNEFSRQKKGEKQPCNINHIINNCVLMLKHQLTENIIVYKNYDESWPSTLGNNGQLHQVFLNILTNAIHATSSGGDINIRTQKVGDKITVEIHDTGNGISPDKLNKITEPFFTTKAPGEGTGLGLSIVYNILKEHKADLRFESEVNKGTNVIIIFESQTQ